MNPKNVPPCQAACPIRTDARGYISAIERGDAEAAIKINRQVNPLPAICGRICPRPCERVCRRGQVDEPIAIAALKRFASDNSNSLSLIQKPENVHDEKIAVIGGGPAGLAAAHDLALLGYKVTILDGSSRLGGMLVEGIPEYRLPKDVVMADIDFILALGVAVRTGLYLGRDYTIESLLKDFQGVVLAIGSQRSLFPRCKGIELSRIYTAVDFLKQVSRGQRPRLGAENGDVEKVRCIKIALGEPDESGRPSPRPVPNSEFELPVDTVISAIGYMPEEESLKSSGISTREHHRVIVNNKCATNLKNVFACGDVVSGPSSLIEAIATGKKTARSVHCYFRNPPEESEIYYGSGALSEKMVQFIPKEKRLKIPTLSIEDRINSFSEVELGYNWEQAMKEAQRCLKCGTSELVKKLRGHYHSAKENI